MSANRESEIGGFSSPLIVQREVFKSQRWIPEGRSIENNGTRQSAAPTIKSVFRFEIQATCSETGARAGIFHTAHGDIETPVFMPVGTQATVKGLLPRDLINDLDAKIILGNTYHLYPAAGA